MDTVYLLTVALVGIGGVVCLVLAATGFRSTNRVSTGLIGLVSLGYVGYVLFSTGDVWVFPLAALIPIGAVVQAFKGPRVRTA